MNCLLLCLLFLGKTGRAQPAAVTLDECHAVARQHWPLAGQAALFEKQAAFQIDNLRKGRLPQVNLLAQATVQNEVTRLPLDNLPFEVPVLSRDQYKLAAEGSYTLWDGGLQKVQAANFERTRDVELARNEVELRRLREQVDLFFFQSLLAAEASGLVATFKNDLETRLLKVEAAVKNGTAIPANADQLRAEIVKTEQRLIELAAAEKTFRELLAELTGLPIGEATLLKINGLDAEITGQVPGVLPANLFEKRPEAALFEKQKAAALGQMGLISNRLRPRLAVFAQAGYGRPGFNFLRDEFRPFALAGLRANWPLSGFYTKKNDRSLVGLQVQIIENQRLAFERSLSLQARQQAAEVLKIEALLEKDPEVVALRERVKTTAAAQLDNGTITAGDYLIEANAEQQARLAQRQREVQLAFERARLATILNQ